MRVQKLFALFQHIRILLRVWSPCRPRCQQLVAAMSINDGDDVWRLCCRRRHGERQQRIAEKVGYVVEKLRRTAKVLRRGDARFSTASSVAGTSRWLERQMEERTQGARHLVIVVGVRLSWWRCFLRRARLIVLPVVVRRMLIVLLVMFAW